MAGCTCRPVAGRRKARRRRRSGAAGRPCCGPIGTHTSPSSGRDSVRAAVCPGLPASTAGLDYPTRRVPWAGSASRFRRTRRPLRSGDGRDLRGNAAEQLGKRRGQRQSTRGAWCPTGLGRHLARVHANHGSRRQRRCPRTPTRAASAVTTNLDRVGDPSLTGNVNSGETDRAPPDPANVCGHRTS